MTRSMWCQMARITMPSYAQQKRIPTTWISAAVMKMSSIAAPALRSERSCWLYIDWSSTLLISSSSYSCPMCAVNMMFCFDRNSGAFVAGIIVAVISTLTIVFLIVYCCCCRTRSVSRSRSSKGVCIVFLWWKYWISVCQIISSELLRWNA